MSSSDEDESNASSSEQSDSDDNSDDNSDSDESGSGSDNSDDDSDGSDDSDSDDDDSDGSDDSEDDSDGSDDSEDSDEDDKKKKSKGKGNGKEDTSGKPTGPVDLMALLAAGRRNIHITISIDENGNVSANVVEKRIDTREFLAARVIQKYWKGYKARRLLKRLKKVARNSVITQTAANATPSAIVEPEPVPKEQSVSVQTSMPQLMEPTTYEPVFRAEPDPLHISPSGVPVIRPSLRPPSLAPVTQPSPSSTSFHQHHTPQRNHASPFVTEAPLANTMRGSRGGSSMMQPGHTIYAENAAYGDGPFVPTIDPAILADKAAPPSSSLPMPRPRRTYVEFDGTEEDLVQQAVATLLAKPHQSSGPSTYFEKVASMNHSVPAVFASSASTASSYAPPEPAPGRNRNYYDDDYGTAAFSSQSMNRPSQSQSQSNLFGSTGDMMHASSSQLPAGRKKWNTNSSQSKPEFVTTSFPGMPTKSASTNHGLAAGRASGQHYSMQGFGNTSVYLDGNANSSSGGISVGRPRYAAHEFDHDDLSDG